MTQDEMKLNDVNRQIKQLKEQLGELYLERNRLQVLVNERKTYSLRLELTATPDFTDNEDIYLQISRNGFLCGFKC